MSRSTLSNPFQTLYLSEALTDPELYWDLFSPKIITGEAQRLFREGNVVLLGSNGTGKTMLLRLFDSRVRSAFLEHDREVPLPEDTQRFLSVGINFVVAGVGALGKRQVSADLNDNINLWSLLFGDFLNYYLVGELLLALKFLQSEKGRPLAEYLEANAEEDRLNEFACWIRSRDCWFGALMDANSFDSLQSLVDKRIFSYRAFANWNSKELQSSITQTKTDFGIPLSEARTGLVNCGILNQACPLMITLDQYETLIHIDYETKKDREDSIGRAFCRVVNSFMATRKPDISYKVGVRPYSWGRELRAFGTDARIEYGRDYQRVDLDKILRRPEDTATWIFPQFARDVASRRMAWMFKAEDWHRWPEKYLDNLDPEVEIQKYCTTDPLRLLPSNPSWPESWNIFLKDLYTRNKFQAKLAEVWLLQEIGRGKNFPPPADDIDGTRWNRPYWQKERREALLTQIASQCRQRRLYGGWDALVTLSGSNVLVFLSLCREIWDSNERMRSKGPEDYGAKPAPISPEVQSQAIRLISEEWLNKQLEFPGGAHRQDVIIRLGIGIRKELLTDKALSNPGHNGFSLLQEEYDSPGAEGVKSFLENATDFGGLVSMRHTNKERDGRPRKKWYIFPILCPNFDVPAVRTKEPYYASLAEVKTWLSDDRQPITFNRGRRRRKEAIGAGNDQTNLFNSTEEK